MFQGFADMDPINARACLRVAARRLRYLRRYPSPHTYETNTEQVRLGMAYAYENALRVIIDEFGLTEEFHSLFYGPQNEDPDLQGQILSN
jgi:hypothetical protein